MRTFRVIAAMVVITLVTGWSSAGAEGEQAEPAPHTPNGSHDAQAPSGGAHDAAASSSPELDAQLEEVRAATARYRDHAAAIRDGYEQFGRLEGPLMGEHWYDSDIVEQPLDLSRPSTLMYATIDGERELVGVAYTVYRRPEDPMPEGFVGDQDQWHVHDVAEIARTAVADRAILSWILERRIAAGKVGGGDGRTHLTMVHAWVWSENPDGVFAQDNRTLPYLRAGLPALYAAEGDEPAAQGVALLAEDGCDQEIQRLDFTVKLDGYQEDELRQACGRAAAEVDAAFATDLGADGLNAAASQSWAQYEAARDQALRPEQHARLDVGIEHDT